MKLYNCSRCGNPLYFENTSCVKCGHTIGFEANQLELITLAEDKTPGIFCSVMKPKVRYKFCSNRQYNTCNWLIDAQDDRDLCVACTLNRTIPPLTPENLKLWGTIEIAKHRLIYSLLRLKLPVNPKSEQDDGLAFDFLTALSPGDKVMTGHYEGLITLNIAEADEAQRVKNKLDLGEKYRTLLGHFRHEVGHYYWDVLIKNGPLESFRDAFGDESQSYEDALKTYYEKGAPADWTENFISPYASAHPWEDWAESWAHYLHMMDALETAYYFGMSVKPGKSHRKAIKLLGADMNKDPYTIREFETVLSMWLPLTFAVNSLNRSMGHPDFYPFVVAPHVIRKLAFIHSLIWKNQKRSA